MRDEDGERLNAHEAIERLNVKGSEEIGGHAEHARDGNRQSNGGDDNEALAALEGHVPAVPINLADANSLHKDDACGVYSELRHQHRHQRKDWGRCLIDVGHDAEGEAQRSHEEPQPSEQSEGGEAHDCGK